MSAVLDPVKRDSRSDAHDDGPIITHRYVGQGPPPRPVGARALCGNRKTWPPGRPWKHLPRQACVVCEDLWGAA